MTSHDEHYVICLFSGRKEERNKEIDGNRAYTVRYSRVLSYHKWLHTFSKPV